MKKLFKTSSAQKVVEKKKNIENDETANEPMEQVANEFDAPHVNDPIASIPTEFAADSIGREFSWMLFIRLMM